MPDTDRRLRVVHCPVNTAGVPWANVQALRRRGIEARLVVFNRYKLHSEADWSLERRGGLLRRQATQWSALARLIPRTDVFHFYFGLTLVPQSAQFPILSALRKKSVMHYLGSDIRGKSPDQLAFGKKAGAEVVGSYDAIRWVPEAEMIPPGLVEGLHHDAAFERYRAADIVVDQLNAGWYGLFAIECMALGKPVVTFLHDEAVARTERELGVRVPLVNASKGTLRERLEALVKSAAERRRIGAESRAYVSRVHDLERVADRLLDLYARL